MSLDHCSFYRVIEVYLLMIDLLKNDRTSVIIMLSRKSNLSVMHRQKTADNEQDVYYGFKCIVSALKSDISDFLATIFLESIY